MQLARPHCPSPTPGVYQINSSLLSRWCHPTISSSVIRFSFCLHSFPASGSFPMSQFFASGGQSIRASASAAVLIYSYNGILLSHKKEHNWVICRDMDGPRVCLHIEWSKSEREKQILHINTYTWNLEKWYKWTYLQSRNRHRGGKKSIDTKQRKRWWDEPGH